MEDFSQKELTLRDILRVVFRHKIILVLSFVVVMTSVYVALDLRTPVYESEVKILVAGKMQRDLQVERSLGPGSEVSTQMSLVISRPVLKRVVEALKLYQRPLDYERRYATKIKAALIDRNTMADKQYLDSMTSQERHRFLFNKAMGDLAGNVTVYPLGQTSIFSISVTDYNSVNAGRIANVISRSYIIFDLEQQIAELNLTYGEKNANIKKLEEHIERLEETLDGRILPDIEAIGPASVKIIAQAGLGRKIHLRPTKAGGLTAGFIMSMVLGVVLAFVFDFFDQTFRSSQDIEKLLKVHLLGSLPVRKSGDEFLTSQFNPVSRYVRSIQNLSNNIYVSMSDKNIKTLLITDIEGSDDVSVITTNIGLYLSQKSGHRVFIIDANFRSPSIHRCCNIPDVPGLADVLNGSIQYEMAVNILSPNLYVLPAGSTESSSIALLESDAMSELINTVKEQYEIVLITSSNLKDYSDAITLSSMLDSVAFVINEGTVRRQVAKAAIEPLVLKNNNIMGALLNNHKYVIPEIIYRLT